MSRSVRRLGFLAILAVPASPQEPAYVGAAVCAPCHPRQYESQGGGGHALTLHRTEEHPLFDRFQPRQPLRLEPRYRFVYSRHDGGFRVAADDGEYLLDLPLEWAFGAGAHGVTFVSQSDERHYVEHTFSFYPTVDGLAVTTGHESLRPETLHQAVGLAYRATADGIGRCFACHSTGGISFDRSGEVRVQEHGVRCEACHGAGTGHIQALAADEQAAARLAIDNPKRRSPSELNAFCGDCHRRPQTPSVDFYYREAWNVRHQPPYLARSRCFVASTDLSCLSCHDPHRNVRREEPPFYRDKCLGCHLVGDPRPVSACGSVEQSDCVECHMPEVRVGDHLAFRNHWIGVFTGSDKIIPSR